MIFNSLTYLLLLFVVVLLYWVLSYRLRILLVFFSSLVFYGFWRIEFIPVMLFSVLMDYFIALRMSHSQGVLRKRYLWMSVSINLGLLFYFKYLIFFTENALSIATLIGYDIDPFALNIILPLGISFYTFQTISYTVDVYRERIKPEKDFVLYSCYVTFFPQLIAGPILRANEVISQFKYRKKFQIADITTGAKRILYGMFLKVVLADNISPLVDEGFLMPAQQMSAIDVWTLSFLFGFQIYFDFSAYSHIAIGSARLFGLKFPENFIFPYISISPKDFWRRWHISLSSWIRDYLYLPLAGVTAHDKSCGGLGKIVTSNKKSAALIVTWLLMGLWHGASWTFVLWGLFHAIFIFLYRIASKMFLTINDNIKYLLGFAITLPLVMLSWIPFRSESVESAITMWLKVFNFSSYTVFGMRENTYLVTAILTLGFFITYAVKSRLPKFLSRYPLAYVISNSLIFSFMITMVFVFFNSTQQFIYFQF